MLYHGHCYTCGYAARLLGMSTGYAEYLKSPDRPPSFVRSLSITKWAARISREQFDLESPNSTRTFMQTNSMTILDMTSPVNSGWNLAKLEKSAENAASDGFGSNFSGAAAFCMAQSIGELLDAKFEWRSVSQIPPAGGRRAHVLRLITSFGLIFVFGKWQNVVHP